MFAYSADAFPRAETPQTVSSGHPTAAVNRSAQYFSRRRAVSERTRVVSRLAFVCVCRLDQHGRRVTIVAFNAIGFEIEFRTLDRRDMSSVNVDKSTGNRVRPRSIDRACALLSLMSLFWKVCDENKKKIN